MADAPSVLGFRRTWSLFFLALILVAFLLVIARFLFLASDWLASAIPGMALRRRPTEVAGEAQRLGCRAIQRPAVCDDLEVLISGHLIQWADIAAA